MGFVELFILAIGVSMDAFAVSICKGLSVKKLRPKHCLICGLYFGIFQAVMPLIGWFLGMQFQSLITSVDHWIAFVLLGVIGFNMIREALGKDDEEETCECQAEAFDFKTMLPLAVATSIDALAIGVTLAFLDVNIVPAVSFIGITTFVCSSIGVKIGNVFGVRFKSKAELLGGVVLVAIGLKILIEHLFFGG